MFFLKYTLKNFKIKPKFLYYEIKVVTFKAKPVRNCMFYFKIIFKKMCCIFWLMNGKKVAL